MCNLNAFHPSLNIPSYVAASDRTTYVSCSHENYYQWLRRKSKSLDKKQVLNSRIACNSEWG